jgi:uncharacterized protein DUF3667
MSTISPSFSPAYSPDYTAPVAHEACLNCNAPRMGEYCHGCGQHFLQGRLTVRGLIWEFTARKLSLEGGLVRTFVDLSSRPGAMIRDYVRGRRQSYTHPVAYLLISTMVSAFMLPLTKDAYLNDLRATDWGFERAESEALVQIMMAFENYPTASTLLLCCFFVPLLRLLFWSRVTTAESFVFALFVFGHALLLEALLKPVAVMVSTNAYDTVTDWSTILLIGLLTFSAGGFFGVRFSTFLRVGLAAVGSLLCIIFGVLVLAAMWGLIAAQPAAAAM